MGVNRAGLLSVKRQMTVCLVHSTRAAFFFEVINGRRERLPLHQVLLHRKRKGANPCRPGVALEVVASFSCEGIEVDCPEIPVPPFLHWTNRLRFHREDLLVSRSVVQRTARELISSFTQNHRMLRRVWLVPDVIGKNLLIARVA